MTDIPFLAVGVDEIQNLSIVEGAILAKVGTGIVGPVGFGVNAGTGEKTNMIGAVKHRDGHVYLAVVGGKLMNGWEIVS